MPQLLHQQHGCALSHHKPVSVRMERSGGQRGVVIPFGGEGAGPGEAGYGQGSDARLCSTCNHSNCVPVRDEPGCVPYGVRSSGAGRGHGVVGTLQAVFDADVARSHVHQDARHEEGAHSAVAPLPESSGGAGDLIQRHHPHAYSHPRAEMLLRALGAPPRVLKSQLSGSEGHHGGRGHAVQLPACYKCFLLKLALVGPPGDHGGHFTGDSPVLLRVQGDNATVAPDEAVPCQSGASGQGTHQSYSSNNNPPPLRPLSTLGRNPNEEKYRSIRIGNPTFSTKLLPVKGAVECLFEMGFEEAETHLVFPPSASVEQLKLIRESIAAERDLRMSGERPVQPASQPAAASTSAPQTAAASCPSPAPSTQQPSSLESSMSFFVTLQSNFQHVMQYENLELQLKARSIIPHQQLSSAAEHQLKELKEADPECKVGMEECLVLQLLRWFKQDFFSWVDCLPCSQCGGPTTHRQALSPTAEELRWGAQRVENHYCQSCQLSTRFPRYNHPEKLLETRRGRCGEWANCFTLCCRALGLEARYIWDSTDHVWTEVYSVAQRRWLHCDSCENVCDKPLLYEVGWGKKLAYVLAFSKDQVVDVTWRYSCKHPEVLSRRTRVKEAWLLHTINGLNAARQQSLSPDRKRELTERLLVELVEFISPKKPKPGELGGRNSGSLAWRIARGETRGADAKASTQAEAFVFTPTEEEKKTRLLHVRYSASTDQYCRVSNSSEIIQSWDQCVWKKDSVFRKVETDWKMAYIARTEGFPVGRVSWKFDLAPAGFKIHSVSVMARSQTFHSGNVSWSLQSGQTTTEFSGDGQQQPFPSLAGSSELIVAAELSGGDGDNSWQHSQLFRQALDEQEPSFEVIIQLQDA